MTRDLEAASKFQVGSGMQRTLIACVLIGVSARAGAAERWSLERLERYEIPVRARRVATADSFADNVCSWSARACSRPAIKYGRAGAPALGCAIESNGALACWSMMIAGLFADDLALERPIAGTDFVDVAVGRAQICLLAADGSLSCFHYAWDSANETWLFTAPVEQPGRFRSVTAGGRTFCAIEEPGGVAHCWREPTNCRNRAEGTSPRPVTLDCPAASGGTVIGGTEDSVAVSVSINGGCALRNDERVVCWGKLGDGAPSGQASPMTQVGRSTAVAVTWDRACARRKSGAMSCWPTPLRDAPRETQAIATRGDTLCWIDASARLWCRAGAEPARRIADGAADVALGEQLCVRSTDDSVTCWAEPYRRGVRDGETTVATFLTLTLGGGLATENAAGLFDLSLRAHVLFGSAEEMHGRAQHQAWGLGAIAEVRSRNFETVEPAAGIELHHHLSKHLPWIELAALGGYAFRPQRSEPVVGLTAAVLAIGPVWRGHEFLQDHWLRNFLIGLSLGARYGLTHGRAELTAGLEVEVLAPWLTLGN
jgi:hypothetical protein